MKVILVPLTLPQISALRRLTEGPVKKDSVPVCTLGFLFRDGLVKDAPHGTITITKAGRRALAEEDVHH